MLPAGGWILCFVLFGELRQIVFCDGFFEVHKSYGDADSGSPAASLFISLAH
jgi:hypothetical protein